MINGSRGQRDAAIADFEKALEVAPAGWQHRKMVQGLLDAARKEQ